MCNGQLLHDGGNGRMNETDRHHYVKNEEGKGVICAKLIQRQNGVQYVTLEQREPNCAHTLGVSTLRLLMYVTASTAPLRPF